MTFDLRGIYYPFIGDLRYVSRPVVFGRTSSCCIHKLTMILRHMRSPRIYCRDQIEHIRSSTRTRKSRHITNGKTQGWRVGTWTIVLYLCASEACWAIFALCWYRLLYAPCLCEEREEDLCPSGTLGVLWAPVESIRLQTFEVVLSHRHVYLCVPPRQV